MKIWFRKLLFLSLITTFLVILAGGVVRTTGSGMGCPDWPKCFGQYIPPTDISQLPPNYKEVYKVQGKEIADFVAFKTWVEYANRLCGALLGMFVLGAFITSFSYRNEKKRIPILAFVILILVLFEAWLGSVVVASNLAPVKITTHMLVAFGIIALISYTLVYERFLYNPPTEAVAIPKNIRNWFIFVIALFVLQVVMGTQVREEVDRIANDPEGVAPRDKWIDLLPGIFFIHRSFSLFWSALFVYLLMQVSKLYRQNTGIYKPLVGVAIVVGAEILSGVIMNYFAVPKAVQPIHLLLSTLIFGLLSLSFINMVLRSKNYASNSLTAK